VHSASWYSSEYYIAQVEHANGPFNSMSFLGCDPERASCFSWSVDNAGFANEYWGEADGDTWRFTGKQARATIMFSDDGRTQTHHWEFKPEGKWITLCHGVATRIG